MNNEHYNLSLYSGELTPGGVVEATAKIKKAFPALPPEFFDVLIDMVKNECFSDNRFMDAVNNVIKNCEYPTPTVAKFLSFDKSVKLYTYSDMIKLVNTDRKAFEKHKAIKVQGTKEPLWAHISDIERYKLERYVHKRKHP